MKAYYEIVDHGKSKLIESLVTNAGVTPHEAESGPRVNSAVNSIIAEIPDQNINDIEDPTPTEGSKFLMQIVDTPGRADFSSKATSVLRLVDGALLAVDAVQGASLQTENVLRIALNESIKPVIFLDNLEKAIVEWKLGKEELYQAIRKTVESINKNISTFQGSYDEENKSWDVVPERGNVAFGSADQGWAFTTRTFAKRYSKRFGMNENEMMAHLWGDSWFDAGSQTWTTNDPGGGAERAFNQFILDPIYQIFDATANGKRDSVFEIAHNLGVMLPKQLGELDDKDFFRAVMQKVLPAPEAITDMVILHLPSPKEVQKHHVGIMYSGPSTDEAALAIRDCNSEAGLVVYVSRMVSAADSKQFYALGRVFAGVLKPGMDVRIQGPSYIPGRKDDLFIKNIQETVQLMGAGTQVISTGIPAGNIVGITGIDQFLVNSGTLTTYETAHNIRTIKKSSTPIVSISVEPKDPSNLPDLVDGLKRLSRSDPGASTEVTWDGQHIVAGISEMHLNGHLKELQDDLSDIDLNISDPFIQYRETVTIATATNALSKSPNKHNRLYLRAAPLTDDLIFAIESGNMNFRASDKTRESTLVKNHGWSVAEAKKVWAFGPDDDGPNILVDTTVGVPRLLEIKDGVKRGFQWATKEGPICEEPIRGVRFNLVDATMMADAIHRGTGQILPTTRRVTYASVLMSKPALLEPIYLVEIQGPQNIMIHVSDSLTEKGGRVISQEQQIRTTLFNIKGYLPVRNSFGFAKELSTITGRQEFPEFTLDHWSPTGLGDPLDPTSVGHKIVFDIRKRKGLKEGIPSVDVYYDKL
ncbi:hypothetical protein H072_11056 [Dactylellina haptotyla CBS 200.50]|uniref:Tr-type G domain-containing protein n=1 Tax=Dactylellina haptotyla (strain CBS 200.50) TaxID=1284197 RepID=S8A335_DACHA|nr:hypothetical protein H072_11056 [Dactylellina haptotyla CBS 200.50]